MLFSKSIDDYVPQNRLAGVVNNIVEQLDTKNIEDRYSKLGHNLEDNFMSLCR